MILDGQFLFDNQLTAGLESLIAESKNKLVLISPFIDLDARIKSALQTKLHEKSFSLVVLFGKNGDNYLKSIKSESLDFLMQFSNIEIRYEERLHAKFYMNDFHYIVTSMNLYNYSLANNIEFGLKVKHSSRSLIGKVGDLSNQLVDTGVTKLKEKMVGTTQEIDLIEKFQSIIDSSRLLFKTEPILEDASGIAGLMGRQNLVGRKEVVNIFAELQGVSQSSTLVGMHKNDGSLSDRPRGIGYKSKSQLSKLLGVPASNIQAHFEARGYITGDRTTPAGEQRGLRIIDGRYGPYIGYPENLEELKTIR